MIDSDLFFRGQEKAPQIGREKVSEFDIGFGRYVYLVERHYIGQLVVADFGQHFLNIFDPLEIIGMRKVDYVDK